VCDARRSGVAFLLVALALVTGCVAVVPPRNPPAAEKPAAPVAKAPESIAPVVRFTSITARVPNSAELAPVVGRLQRHRIAQGENLLEVARQSGVGFRELRDANPRIDEWEPKAGSEILVPSKLILPQTDARGLIVNVPEMRLYMIPTYVEPGERTTILTWPIGIGAEEAQSPIGPFTVKSKDENPTWVVPDSILRTMERPQRVVPPGPDNPLGAYRIRLSVDVYAIHGTNDPWTVGRLTTHGCIRLYPEDIAELYQLVDRGFPGEIVYQPVKLGTRKGRIYVEVHQDVYYKYPDLEGFALAEVSRAGLMDRIDTERLRAAVRAKTGVPTDITRRPPPGPEVDQATDEKRSQRES
jgi:L,D-transpeptidase ErfK/SrfK